MRGLAIHILERVHKGRARCVACDRRFRLKRVIAVLTSANEGIAYICARCLPARFRDEFDALRRTVKRAALQEQR